VLLALRQGRGDDCWHVSRSGKQLAYWMIPIVAAFGLIPDKLTIDDRWSHLILVPYISPSSSCPTGAGKAGSRFHCSEHHPARSPACRLHHTPLAGKCTHEASVPHSGQVCARRNAKLDLSGAEPPSNQQWRAEARQWTGFQRVSRLVLLYRVRQKLSNTNHFVDSCERCRRQKIKCSGKEPCDACQKRRLLCNFDEQNQKILVTRESVGAARCTRSINIRIAY